MVKTRLNRQIGRNSEILRHIPGTQMSVGIPTAISPQQDRRGTQARFDRPPTPVERPERAHWCRHFECSVHQCKKMLFRLYFRREALF